MRRHSHGRGAFTLTELLVVIVILGILMAVAVPTFLRQQTKAQDSRTQQYLTTAFEAIRSGTADTSDQYPNSTSMVSWIQQSEPELTAQRGDCLTGVTSAPVDAVLVDPSSTADSLQLCARSQSGNVWKLTATATGVQQLLDGTLVPLTMSGNEITDATRAAGVQGDGLSGDSSTGIWEGTTNLVSNGGFESSTSGWMGSIGGFARVNTRAKFGLYSATSATGDGYGPVYQTTATALGGAGTYTFSAWVWIDSAWNGSQVHASVYRSGTYTSLYNLDMSKRDQWQRIVIPSITVAAGDSDVEFHTADRSYGATTGKIYVDGVQIEQKSYATPYVETNGTTATRNAARVQVPATSLSATQGWVALRVRMGVASANGNLFTNAFTVGSGSDWIECYWRQSDGRWHASRSNGSGTDSTSSGVDSWVAGDYRTLLFAWNATSIRVSVDGGAFASSGVGHVPASLGSLIDVGYDHLVSNYWLDGDVLWAATGTGTLNDADAATANSWGNTDPTRSQFPASAKATMVWNGVGASGRLK